MIERNTTIPAKKSQVFSTAADNQPAVAIRICQGERKMFEDNKILGNFRLDGIDAAPRGVPQIEVTFDIDANGILHVSAKDKKSGKEQKISIEGSSGLSDEEIEKAKREAEEHAEEDAKRAEAIQLKNDADSMVHQVEKQIEEMGDQAPAELKTEIQGKVDAVKEALKEDDLDKIKSSKEELEAMLQQLAQAAQAAGGAGAAGPMPGAGAAPAGEAPQGESSEPKAAKGKVVDAEVVED
jgi:molecular chaperone DnaK